LTVGIVLVEGRALAHLGQVGPAVLQPAQHERHNLGAATS
jgi:hypothetical protein